MSEYSYDMGWEQERDRLRGIEAQLDPGTIDVFRRIGVGIDWRCLEIGAGGGSIAEWLADRAEHVVATDLDTQFLNKIDAPNLEVRRHDIVSDTLEEESFDLIHSRMLLEHLPAVDDVLKKLVAALRPGGYLFVESVDFSTTASSDPDPMYPEAGMALMHKVVVAIITLMQRNGYSPRLAIWLPTKLRAVGLDDVEGEFQSSLIYGGSPAAAFATLTLKQLGPVAVQSGAITQDELNEATARAEDPMTSWMAAPAMRAWGRKS